MSDARSGRLGPADVSDARSGRLGPEVGDARSGRLVPEGPEAIAVDPSRLDLELIAEVEHASVDGWPPTHIHELPDGWVLRATPEIDSGRACHALSPSDRRLTAGELPRALERVRAWSALHGIRGGLQVSPLELHAAIVPGLLAAGWEPMWKVWVMVADREEVLSRARAHDSFARVDEMVWTAARRPDRVWLDAWAACRGGREGIDGHVASVFQTMGERGVFGRLGELATGIAVEDVDGEWAGLFALVVSEGVRGRGLGRRLVLSLLESVAAPQIYLQVEMSNTVAQRLYTGLGFRATHSYQHLRAPRGWATG